jgi:hypothetical protein
LLYVHGVAHEATHAHSQARLDRTRISRSFAHCSP